MRVGLGLGLRLGQAYPGAVGAHAVVQVVAADVRGGGVVGRVARQAHAAPRVLLGRRGGEEGC